MLASVSLAAAALISSAVSAISGLGGGILLFAILNLFVAPQVALALHAFAQFVSNLSRVAAYYRYFGWRLFPPFAAGSVGGVALAGYAFVSAPERVLEFAIGLLLGIYALFNDQISRSRAVRSVSRRRSFIVIGAATGFLSMIVGAAGPIMAPFLRENIKQMGISGSLGHRMFIATKAVLQVWVQGCKCIVLLFAISFPVSDHTRELIILIAFVVTGTFVGRWVLGRLDTKLLDPIVRSVIFLVALKMCLGLPSNVG